MANVLRDDGVSYGDYLEQITCLLFLKMADEMTKPPYNKGLKFPHLKDAEGKEIPDGELCDWETHTSKRCAELEAYYVQMLRSLATEKGMLGQIYTKSQNKIQDPAKLLRVIEMINRENWSLTGSDVKDKIYEGLLEKNAEDTKSGAGQPLNKDQKQFLKKKTFFGNEIVANTRRLCLMNLYLHNIGELDSEDFISPNDALVSDTGNRYDYVLTNPPFGKKSSITITNEDGEVEKEDLSYNRQDFWETTSNKQLNFLQHIKTLLKINGQAAVVLPDNVLFEGSAGEEIRKQLMKTTELHTILRLPTGIFYANGVKANVLFFDNRPASKDVQTKDIWIYDYRTNIHHTLKKSPLTFEDLADFTGNHNLTILDIREVHIGNHVMVGPHTLITTVGHPLSPKGRRKYHALAKPVRIGDDVWIGGNVTILPGVTIGNNVVVAAGAVVTEDVPDNTLVGGVPAKVIKTIENDL